MSELKLKWGCCNQGKEGDKFIKCSRCNNIFHPECLIETSIDKYDVWICSLCMSLKPKGGKRDDTPVHPATPSEQEKGVTKRSKKRFAPSSSPESASQQSPLSHEDVREIIKSEIHSLVPELTKSLSGIFNSELRSIKEDIQCFKESMNFLNNQYEDFLKDQKLNTVHIEQLKSQNQELTSTVQDLSYRLNDLEQRARDKNVEIQCVPESRSENLINTLCKICEVVECPITEEQITRCTRIVKLDRSSARPRSIVAEFASNKHEDRFLAAVIKFNRSHPDGKLNTSHIDVKGPKKPIYVVEHLSPANKHLHAAARAKAKELNYKYVWVKNGRIFMRKTDHSEYKYIQNDLSLGKLE